MDHDHDVSPARVPGGIGRYFTTYQGVGWLVLVGLLAWGGLAYGRLAQQEDPEFPSRTARLVTVWPGAAAAQVEDLVTRKLEDAIGENDRVEKITSESRVGASVITVKQRFANQRDIDQQWDDLRSRVGKVGLPSGCGAPDLDTTFGDVTTLLLAVASEPQSPGETAARAAAMRNAIARLRGQDPAAGRACIVGIFPEALGVGMRHELAQRFSGALTESGLGTDCRVLHADGFTIGDFATTADRTELEALFSRFVRSVAADNLIHPDLPLPLLLVGDEDPLPALRGLALPACTYRELEVAAETLQRRLRAVPEVGRATIIGAIPEQITVAAANEALAGRHLDPRLAEAALARRNTIVPAGSLRVEGHRFPVRVDGQFVAERDVADTIVSTANGQAVYLRDLFEVRRGYRDPLGFHAALLQRDGGALALRRAVLVAVEMRKGSVIAGFSAAVGTALDAERSSLPDRTTITVVSDQPRSVATRISTFVDCFAEAVAIVVVVALALMDWRSAVVVATAIPLSVAFTIAGFSVLGIPLHQISIAALIIALGLLVDFPVVATDGINRALAEGRPPATAAWLGVWRLRRPMLYGTLINIAAFLPLVMMPDDKGAFIIALPVGVTLALVGAWLVAIALTPLVGMRILRGQKGLDEGGEPRRLWPFSWIDRGLLAAMPPYRRMLEAALARPWTAVAAAYTLLAAALLLTPYLGRQFFPPAERDQIVVDIRLPQPASSVGTERVVAEVAAIAARHPEVVSGAAFIGGTAPRFYYNVVPKAPDDGIAQLILNTATMQSVPAVVAAINREAGAAVVGARVVARRLEQGPPVDPPIQVRVTGEDPAALRRAGDAIGSALRSAGADRVHDDLESMTPTLAMTVDQDRAALLGVDNQSAGLVASAAFQGITVTELREGDHLVPVVVRLRAAERTEADRIRSLYVTGAGNERLPLSAVADLRLTPAWPSIPRHNRRRSITVSAYPAEGRLAIPTLQSAMPAIRGVTLPPGYVLELDGEAKEMTASQGEMGMIMGVSLALIFLLLVMQFRSLAKAGAVLTTVPLAMIGAVAGLAAFGAPLGFMAMLAIVSLAGVVVSHIIVLSDFIEDARERGMDLREALIRAGQARLRPVLVTVLATVLGLIPLAVRGGELWQPLAGVHIVGLLAGTGLTLIILPVLYWLLATRLRWIS